DRPLPVAGRLCLRRGGSGERKCRGRREEAMNTDAGLVVVKVGGSLYDLPDLGPRLAAWLRTLVGPVLLVPGGGAMADAVRHLDRYHGLGAEISHELALRSLTMNAWFLAALLCRSA